MVGGKEKGWICHKSTRKKVRPRDYADIQKFIQVLNNSKPLSTVS
jgi:hypothetical protein